MKTLYVAGPIPRSKYYPLFLPYVLTAFSSRRAYENIRAWCKYNDFTALIPSEAKEPFTDPGKFGAYVRSLIETASHVLVVPYAPNLAVGIEAEYAYQQKKPIGVWYPGRFMKSKLLMSLATIEAEPSEDVRNFLDRFAFNKT